MCKRVPSYLRLGGLSLTAGLTVMLFQNCSTSAFSPMSFGDKPWGMFSFLSMAATEPTTMKSISRFEMLNATRDLIGSDALTFKDIAELSADPKLGGFESAATQTYSLSFIEGRLGLAEKAAALALRSNQVVSCEPDRTQAAPWDGCVSQVVRTFASRAYRRPLTNEDVTALMNTYQSAVASANAELDVLPRAPVVGIVDDADGQLIVRGWSFDPSWSARTVELHVYVDGQYDGNTFANQPRPDVNAAYAAQNVVGDHGFAYRLSAKYADGVAHTVVVYAIGGSPAADNPNLGSRTFTAAAVGEEPVVPVQIGAATEEGLRAVFTLVLTSPAFQLRTLSNLPNDANVAKSLRLANALAWFLTGSLPDARLAALAGQGRLVNETTFTSEVTRLAKTYSEKTAFHVFGQWFGFRELALRPDITPLEQSMIRESTLVFKELIDQNMSDLSILSPGFTFVDSTLANHYGIPFQSGGFAKVARNDRGGLLTQGAILRLTSPTNVTKPITRGKWVQWNLLCRTIPPPDQALFQQIADAQAKADPNWTVSERLEQHRKAGPACSGCHQYMDPLGLALEGYSPLGQVRTIYEDTGKPVVARGVLDGQTFNGVAELNQIVKSRDDFRACVVSRLLTHGLARVISPDDHPLLLNLAFEHLGLRDLLTQIATSPQFKTAALED